MGRHSKIETARRVALLAQGFHICSKCGETKPVAEFSTASPSSGNFGGLSSQCKSCFYVYSKSWASENRERVREAGRESMRRARQANPEKVRAYEREQYRRFRESNPEIVHARGSAYRGGVRAGAFPAVQEVTLRADDILRVFRHYGGKCLACGATEQLTADHIVPLCDGGAHAVWNIQPLCASCNSSKGSRHATDYRPDKGAAFRPAPIESPT